MNAAQIELTRKTVFRILLYMAAFILGWKLYNWFSPKEVAPQGSSVSGLTRNQWLTANSGTPDEVKIVLRHPLIPGGLKNLNDFKAHVNRDSNLKRFYEANGFDFSCVSQDTLDQNEWAQVTYRSNKDIKWSNTPLLLLKGEMIFKDCQGHVIRAQCGNSVAYVKDDIGSLDLPISPLVETPETTEIASNTPIPSIGTLPTAPWLPIEIEVPTEGGGDYGGSYGLYGGGGTGGPQRTPEPSTGILLGVGMLVLGLKKTLTNPKFSGRV